MTELPESLTGHWVRVSLTTFSLWEIHNHSVRTLKTGVSEKSAWKYYQRSLNCPSQQDPFQQNNSSDTLTKHTEMSSCTSFSLGSLLLLSPLRRRVSSEENSANSTTVSLSEFTSLTLPSPMRHSGCTVTFYVFLTKKKVFGNFLKWKIKSRWKNNFPEVKPRKIWKR